MQLPSVYLNNTSESLAVTTITRCRPYEEWFSDSVRPHLVFHLEHVFKAERFLLFSIRLKKEKKKKKNPDRISGSTQSGKFDKQDKHDFEFLNLVNNQNRVEYSMTLVSWGKRFTSRRKEVRFVRAHRRIHAFTVSFSFTYNGLFTDWNT